MSPHFKCKRPADQLKLFKQCIKAEGHYSGGRRCRVRLNLQNDCEIRNTNEADEITTQSERDAQFSKVVTTRRDRVSKPPA